MKKAILIILLNVGQIFPQDSIIDSLFTNVAFHENYKVLWNDSCALKINMTNSKVDTIFKNLRIDDDSDPNSMPYYYYESYKILSIVGNCISYVFSYNGSGGAHPIYGGYYKTYNILDGEDVSLTHLFDSKEIFDVFRNDTTISKHLTSAGSKNLSEFINGLDGGCAIRFKSILKTFSIVNVDSNKAEVEFGLTHGCELMRGNFTKIKVVLKTPNEKIPIFTKAKENKTLKIYLDPYGF